MLFVRQIYNWVHCISQHSEVSVINPVLQRGRPRHFIKHMAKAQYHLVATAIIIIIHNSHSSSRWDEGIFMVVPAAKYQILDMNTGLLPEIIFFIFKSHKFGGKNSFRQRGLRVPTEYFMSSELLLFKGTMSRKERPLSSGRASGKDGWCGPDWLLFQPTPQSSTLWIQSGHTLIDWVCYSFLYNGWV